MLPSFKNELFAIKLFFNRLSGLFWNSLRKFAALRFLRNHTILYTHSKVLLLLVQHNRNQFLSLYNRFCVAWTSLTKKHKQSQPVLWLNFSLLTLPPRMTKFICCRIRSNWILNIQKTLNFDGISINAVVNVNFNLGEWTPHKWWAPTDFQLTNDGRMSHPLFQDSPFPNTF